VSNPDGIFGNLALYVSTQNPKVFLILSKLYTRVQNLPKIVQISASGFEKPPRAVRAIRNGS